MMRKTSEPKSRVDRAVSPVIAVALLIGLAVALAGLVGVAATGLIDDFGQGPSGDVSFDQDSEEDEVDITITSLDSGVDSVEIRGAGSGDFENVETGAVETVDDLDDGDRITIVAVDLNEGTEESMGEHVFEEFSDS